MVVFEDQGNFLVDFLLPLAIAAYLLVLFLRSGNILQWTIAAIVTFLSYFFLNKGWPDTYRAGSVTMLLTCVGIFAALLFLVYAAAGIMIIVAMLSLAVPTMQHNADLVANYLGAPQWVAFLILFAGLGVLLLLIYLSRIFPLVGYLLKIVFTSFFLQVMLRQLYMEHPPDMDRTDMACFNASTDPPGRCSVAFDSAAWLAALLVLIAVQTYALYACRCRRKKPKSVDYQQVAPSTAAEGEEEDTALF